jgi:hypothetical protein
MATGMDRWLSRERDGVFYAYEMDLKTCHLQRRSLRTRDEAEAKLRFEDPDIYLSGPSVVEAVRAIRKIVKEDDKPGYVYFIKSGDFIKIGFSLNPAYRLCGIQTSNPLECEPLGVVQGSEKAERKIHFLFGHAHHRGEWFRVTPAILETISRVARGGFSKLSTSKTQGRSARRELGTPPVTHL